MHFKQREILIIINAHSNKKLSSKGEYMKAELNEHKTVKN
jgi:hypothetical protein